jgi:hypothetical protein
MTEDELNEPTTELKQLIKLNEKAAKNNLLQVEIREIAKEQRKIAQDNGEKLDTICDYKLEQKIGDMWSRWVALGGVGIAIATLYFSDSPFAQGVRSWLNQLGAL